MSSEIIVAAIAFCGTLCGTFGGIITANKLTNYRIQQLEKKQDKYNNLVERTFKLEGRIDEAEHDIRDLKDKVT